MRRALFLPVLAGLILVPITSPGQDGKTTAVHKLELRSRAADAPKDFDVPAVRKETWPASQTAIIVCDMWDSHHCLNAVRRVGELAPVMNRVLEKARSMGVLIVHAPSSCMEPYKDHPGRKRAQAAPKAKNLPAGIDQWCYKIPAEEKGKYPIDQSDGGEDDEPQEHAEWQAKLKAMGLDPKAPWKREHEAIKIHDEDVISDSGVEIWNVLEERGIKNVILVGVHTNMCVLGRPFGLRQMAKNGKNVVLMRDMTDTMYNPKSWPFVNHFQGTQLIIAHIERYVCPTITSDQVVGGEPFRFKGDKGN
jgi:nicotinamidase-related amidase